MRLEQLRLIHALSSHGSLRAVAQVMNLSQPALTKALRLLEEEFAAPLVVRTPKGVRLTPAGALVAARAATVLREIDRARADVAWQLHHAGAHVAIAASPAAAISVLPGALARLRSRWPQVRLQVVDAVFPRSLTMLRGGEVDLAVGPLPAEGAGRDLRVQALFDVRQVLIARQGSRAARARSLAEVHTENWIVAGPAGGPGDPVHLGFDTLGLPTPPVIVACESFSTLLALLASNDAVALMPETFHDRYAAPAGLVKLPIADPLPNATVHAVWRADAPLGSPAGYLLDALDVQARDLRRQHRPRR